MRKLMLVAPVLNSPWKAVDVPDAAFDYVPFTIQQFGRDFRVDPAFSLQDRAGITVVKTYYVDKSTGNNANTGLDWDNALRDIDGVQAKGDADRVYVRNSTFYYSEHTPVLTRSVEIIGVGDSVYFTGDLSNTIVGGWSASSAHYDAIFGSNSYVSTVYDYGNLDAYGDPQLLTAVANEAAVDAAPGTFYYNYTAPNSTMHLRLADDREPDSNVLCMHINMNVAADNRVFYLENIKFRGGVSISPATAEGGTKAYINNCDITGTMAVAAVEEFIIFNSKIHVFSEDGFNYNYDVTRAIEYNCESYNGGAGSGNQASTTHNGTYSTRIQGKYYQVGGQVVADVQLSTRSWMLGCEFHDTITTDVGVYIEGITWMDCCYIHDVATDLQTANVASIIHTRDLISGGNNVGPGTIDTY